MAAKEPTSRLIGREYFADAEFMTTFSADEREAYIGLAMFADDAGWLVWRPVEIAGSMYRYEDRVDRETKLAAIVDHLAATGRIVIFDCGHARMPRVKPRGLRRAYAVRDEHVLGCTQGALPMHPDALESIRMHTGEHSSALLSSPVLSSPVLSGPGDAQTRDDGEKIDFREAMHRNGLKPSLDRTLDRTLRDEAIG